MKNIIYRSIVSLLAISVIMWSTAAYATNGIRLIGFGPVQRGMGGVGVGLPRDAAATVTNPAGITEVGGRVDVGLTVAVPDSVYSASSAFGQITVNDRVMLNDAPPILIPALGFTTPITEDLFVGIGAYGVSGVCADYEENLYQNVTYVKYTCTKISPVIAYEPVDGISIGAGPVMDIAELTYRAGGIAQLRHPNGTAVGWGWALGALFKPFTLMEFIPLPESLPREFLTVGFAYESEQYFNDFSYDLDQGVDKLELNQPQVVSWGIGLEPIKRFRFGFDMEWINWSQVLGHMMPSYSVNGTNASQWDVDWDDQLVYKLGAEFDVLEDVIVDKLTLRVGYNYGQHPLIASRAFENIALPSITEHHITCGFGIDITENIEFNGAFVYAPPVTFHARNIGTQFINDVQTSTSMYSFDAGLTYKF
ncbi:OmpP1/FadL family transporter [Candidatus Omnitrophota bacterium]